MSAPIPYQCMHCYLESKIRFDEAFLTHLAFNENVAASNQDQALHAILFLYKEILKQHLDLKVDAVRAKQNRDITTVLVKPEVLAIINQLSGVYQLVIKLLYRPGRSQSLAYNKPVILLVRRAFLYDPPPTTSVSAI